MPSLRYISYTIKQSLCSDNLFNSRERTLLLFHGGWGEGVKKERRPLAFSGFGAPSPHLVLSRLSFLHKPCLISSFSLQRLLNGPWKKALMATLDKMQGLALGSRQVHLLGWLCTQLLLPQTHVSTEPSDLLMFISEELLRPLSPGSVFPLLFYAWTPKPDRSQMCNGPSLHHCILELMRRPCCLILW